MPIEIELKLSFPAEALPEIMRHPIIASAPRKEEPSILDNTYFDTPSLTLKAHGVALRLRQQTGGDDPHASLPPTGASCALGRPGGEVNSPHASLPPRGTSCALGRPGGATGEVVQTVKCSAESHDGLTRRPEWETPWHGHFDFSAVTDTAAAALLARVQNELVPIFTTRFSRDIRHIQPRPGVYILAMVDTGFVKAGENDTPIHELELELIEGDEEDLVHLASELRKTLPLAFESVSKAQRGYQLVKCAHAKANSVN